MRTPRLLVVPVLIALALTSGCGETTGSSSGDSSGDASRDSSGDSSADAAGGGLPLEGTPWQLTSYREGGELVPVPADVVATATFSDGQLAGTGGCNRYSAGYSVDGDALQVQPVASTLIACAEPAASVEAAFFSALEEVEGSRTDDETLTLTDADGGELLVFDVAEAATLVGPTWVATGINNGAEAVVSLVEGSSVTAVFDEAGTVSGSGGCNTYTGSYTTTGSDLEIGPLASTLRACPDQEGLDQQEAQFLAAMERATTYRIDATGLELRDDTGALQVSFAAQ